MFILLLEYPNNKTGSFDGKIEEDISRGQRICNPLTKYDLGPWIIRGEEKVVIENCLLELVDEFDIDNQFTYGKGAPL